MQEWLGDVGPIILATVVIITTIWQIHSKTHDKLEAKIDKRFDKVDQRFDKVDERFDRVEDRLSRLEEGIARLEGMMRVFINGKNNH
ncbi:hypothetical protein C6502_19445 [Candidatus Poribacteria bacterium]|nr:MAG: hypothetical protein C6502_19445 [Candidatus Poribacteria bacterium]